MLVKCPRTICFSRFFKLSPVFRWTIFTYPHFEVEFSLSSFYCSAYLLKKAKVRAKRKPRRRTDSSGGYNLSEVIKSSPVDVTQSPPIPGKLTCIYKKLMVILRKHHHCYLLLILFNQILIYVNLKH